MFIRAIIQLADGTEKVVQADGKIAGATFFFKILPYAKKENKIKQIVCDNPIWLEKLRRELPHAKVSMGFKEGNEICVLE